MRNYNTSPLYRSIVGFDRLAALLDAAADTDATSGYRPTISNPLAITPTGSRLPSPASMPEDPAIEAREERRRAGQWT
jgi:molecular chaperone IbpA